MPIMMKRKDGTITPFRNAEYLSAYYFIPKRILEQCGKELNSIPRNPQKLIRCLQFLGDVLRRNVLRCQQRKHFLRLLTELHQVLIQSA